MLSVTDNSQGARGDVSAVAAASPNSEANLDCYGESCRPAHLAQFIGPKPEADSVSAEGLANGTSRGIVALGDLDAADSPRADLP
jgi:hypothetical protein